ncbi:transposase [Cyanobacterium aponinum UTEX 3222]|uniref:RNA-guided endonuclease InsQ/TnpB family protein n=1 Tax=Cyanobacterium aponinum TaxID=379064 RepID=UPI002B4BD99E|nr:transposase [Cyanobacterium aponinum]WRL38759.1 transposase [Cyanobacterium aponinum UTEX 3221]WRL40950.1 transposase [Cyanobacterium aponinum UTEX 3222]
MLTLNYTYRIYPDGKQSDQLGNWLETCRCTYNYALQELKDWIKSRKTPVDRCSLESEYIMPANYPFPSYHQQQNNLPKAKKIFPRLKEVPSQVLQTTIRHLHDGWDFFQRRGYGFPRFKKYGQMKSLLFPQFKTNPITGWQIKLPKLGDVVINLHRPIPEGFVVKQVRVIKKAKGWYAVIALQSDISIPDPVPHGHCIGVDVGLLIYISTSDGFVEPRPKFLKELYRRLKVLQHRLSKKQKRSKNYEKLRKQIEALHNHIAFKRKDYQFKLCHKLCDMADSIFLEDCDFRIMAKGMLSKHTLDASFGQFRSILKYVGKRRGVFVDEVDHRGTSQTCPNCRTEVRKELSERWHSCSECNYKCDRDIASAQEICNRGIEKYSTQGLWGKEIGYQVGLSGAMCLDKWRSDGSLRRRKTQGKVHQERIANSQ